MPVYEYFCPKCKKEFELKRPFSEADKLTNCPQCGSESQKLISAFASKESFYIKGVSSVFRRKTE